MKVSPVLLAVGLSALGACKWELTRDKAAELIGKSSLFSPAASIFQPIDRELEPKECPWSERVLHHREVIAVTGITGEGEHRLVIFRWRWASDPASMKCLGIFGNELLNPAGTAELLRFDDGWRVVDVHTKGALSEEKSLDADLAARAFREKEAKRKKEELEEAARQAETQRRLQEEEKAQAVRDLQEVTKRAEAERAAHAEYVIRQKELSEARKAQADRQAQQRAAIAAAMPTWHAHYLKVMEPVRAALRGVMAARQPHGDLAKACGSFSIALASLARTAEPSPDADVEASFQSLMHRLYDMKKSCSPQLYFQNGQDIEKVTPAFERLEKALSPYNLTP